MEKKGSVFITAFLAAIAIGIFIMISSSSDQGDSSLQDIEPTEQCSEIASTAIYSALQESGTKGSYKAANETYTNLENGYWESYAIPNVPSVADVAGLIADETRLLMNEYLLSLDGQEISGVKIESDAQVSDVTLDVTEEGVFSGKFDNGFSLTATSTGAVECVPESGETGTYQETNFNVPVENWRYFYVYRKMREWVISNEFSQRACNAQPQYGIRGNDIDCLFAPIDIETAKTIFDESVAKLQDSFDKDGLCIYRCPTMDPDCEQESDQEGTCAEDGFCVQSCSDPDCDKCNLKDQYIECTYEMLCGEASVNSQHAGEPTPCEPQADYLGNPEECPGDCVDGCEYHNRVENCMTGACDDMNCPLPDSEGYEGMVPPCMDQTEIEFTAGEYTGREGDPNVPLDTCYGVGTEYKWSLIAEVTCLDKKYEKPIFEARFGTLPLRARIHQYFQQRYHEPFVNECTYSQECVIGPGGGGAGAGEPNTGNTGGGGGSSNPPPGLPNS